MLIFNLSRRHLLGLYLQKCNQNSERDSHLSMQVSAVTVHFIEFKIYFHYLTSINTGTHLSYDTKCTQKISPETRRILPTSLRLLSEVSIQQR
jgi:hypothetical protein